MISDKSLANALDTTRQFGCDQVVNPRAQFLSDFLIIYVAIRPTFKECIDFWSLRNCPDVSCGVVALTIGRTLKRSVIRFVSDINFSYGARL